MTWDGKTRINAYLQLSIYLAPSWFILGQVDVATFFVKLSWR